MLSIDFVAGLLSFLFTLMILSYLIGDNPLFRLAIHIFIGISAGYVTSIIINQVVVERLLIPFITGDMTARLLLAIPLLMSILLLTKISPRLEFSGRPIVAFLVGVGAAAAIAGALTGTIFPQVGASANQFSLSGVADGGLMAERLTEGVFILLGTISTLAYFQFGVRKTQDLSGKRGWFMNAIALTGQVFLAITFGVLFAGVFSASVTALIDRVQSLVNFIASLFI